MVKFISIDAGHARDIVRDYKIRGVPTLVFFKDGKAVDRMLGFKEEDRVKGFIGHIFGITL
jgi:thioredoxin 1